VLAVPGPAPGGAIRYLICLGFLSRKRQVLLRAGAGRTISGMSAACPVPDCPGQPVNGCEFCPAHQSLINRTRLWLDGIINQTGSTFDAERRGLDAPSWRRI
jgi:hypothetical protein